MVEQRLGAARRVADADRQRGLETAGRLLEGETLSPGAQRAGCSRLHGRAGRDRRRGEVVREVCDSAIGGRVATALQRLGNPKVEPCPAHAREPVVERAPDEGS